METRVFLDPLGIDVPAGMLELYTEKYWQQDMIVAHRNLTRSTVLRESDQLSPGDIDSSYMKDYLGGRHVVNVSFFNDEGFLGSLNLNRKKKRATLAIAKFKSLSSSNHTSRTDYQNGVCAPTAAR